MSINSVNWNKKVADINKNCEKYHFYFYNSKRFTGPSLYFHKRSLESSGSDKIEMVYATLASWGMHRMGGGAQMNDFETFQKSIDAAMDDINNIKKIENEIILNKQAEKLNTIYKTINPMHSSIKIVGKSKVLAHYLPNIVCPIDREYTMQFLKKLGTKNISVNDEKELFEQFHNKFVFELINNKEFNKKAREWINSGKYEWDTSIPKVIDNLIIGKILHLKGKV